MFGKYGIKVMNKVIVMFVDTKINNSYILF